MTRNAAMPWFGVALGVGLWWESVWHCCGSAAWEMLGSDALHTVLFDNRHQTHFNVVHGWVGLSGAPRRWEAGFGMVWFLRRTASTIGRRSSVEMDFYYEFNPFRKVTEAHVALEALTFVLRGRRSQEFCATWMGILVFSCNTWLRLLFLHWESDRPDAHSLKKIRFTQQGL